MLKNLQSTEQTILEIRNVLLNSPKIRKLVYYDTTDALTKIEAPTRAQVEFKEDGVTDANYITLFPLLQNGIKEFGRNTYIMITLPSVVLDISEDSNLYPALFITAVTDLDHYKLDGNKLRLLQICDEIIQLIDNKKFAFASKLEVIKLEEVIFDNNTYGYILKVFCADITKGENF